VSRIRIISGRLGRRMLAVPTAGTRPTSSRVREAMFNMVGSRVDLDGFSVLDLFSGTGALGIEALSRGAARAVFVENKPAVLACSEENARGLGLADRCRFVRADVFEFMRSPTESRYHLILADPPYDLSGLEDLPDLASGHLSTNGLFVLEHDRRLDFSGRQDLETTRSYGRTIVSVFNREG